MIATFPHSPSGNQAPRAVRGTLRFSIATIGWITFAVVGGVSGNFEPFWGDGKGLVILITGIQLLLVESVLYYFLLNWSIREPTAPRHVQLTVLYVSAFIGGASLWFIFIGVSQVVVSIPAIAMGDGSVALGASLLGTPLACTAMTAGITRIGVYIVQQAARKHGA